MKILMVCLGNICRSPMAEGILKSKTEGLNIEVDSAGTSNFHAGENPDARAVMSARKHNVNISKQQSRPFTVADFDHFDVIYAMDKSNLNNIYKLARTEEDKQKVKLLLEEISPDSGAEVPDPYFGGDHGFEHVYQLLDEATDQIIAKLNHGK